MMKIFISILLLTNYAYSQTSPECNYAATDTHFYPIGACDKTKTISGDTSTYSSFKFVCEAGSVFKYEYNTDEYCHGESISSTDFTDQLQEFECNSPYLCDYSEHCSYTGCYNSSVNSEHCATCSETTTIWDRHCIPIITDHCMSTQDDNLTYYECVAGVLTSDYYSGANCSDDTSLYATMTIGGDDAADNCFDTAYHTAACYSHAIPPCNYAATIDGYFYPIGACDTIKSTDSTSQTVTYSAFKYMCNNNDVYKHEYNTSDYCQGTAISERIINAELSHYDCSLNDCKFADWCTLTLNECDSIGCDYDSTCLPLIIDNCMGYDGEALIYDTCVNNTLNINHYYGYDCPDSGLIWPETYTTDDTQCGADILDKVQCIDPADVNPIIYHTTDCTQSPTAVTTAPTQYTETPTSQPTTSPSMEPTAISNQPTHAPIVQPEECDVIWKILIRFRVPLVVSPIDEEYEELIQNGCKLAFIDAIKYLLNEWNDLFCVVLSDNDFKITKRRRLYESDMEKRRLSLLETEYEIEIEIEYNNELQNAVFDDDNYDKNSFTEKFSESVSSRFSEDDLVNDGVTVSGLEVEDAEKIDDDDGHSVEGALMNAVSIISIIDVLLFIGCMIYVYSIMRKRVIEKGHDPIPFAVFIKHLIWKEYVVCFIEVFGGIIRWVFIIEVMVVGKTYLGAVGLVILLLGDIVLILRYILYKKLCIEQVNDIMGNISGDNNISVGDSVENVRVNDMKDEIRYRKVDIGMIGLLLMSVEDIPIIILMLIIGENWDYHGIIVLCFIISIISIIMKIILLFLGKYGIVEGNKGYAKKTEDDMKDMLELGTDNKGKGDAKSGDDNKKTDTTALKAETDDVDDKKTDDKKDDGGDVKTDDGGDKKTSGGDKKTSGGGDKKTTGGKKEEYAD